MQPVRPQVWPSFGVQNAFEVIRKAKKSVLGMNKGKILFKIAPGFEGSRPIFDATRPDRDSRVRRLHKDFLTRFLGRDKQQTSYDREQRYDFTSYRSCLGETTYLQPTLILHQTILHSWIPSLPQQRLRGNANQVFPYQSCSILA